MSDEVIPDIIGTSYRINMMVPNLVRGTYELVLYDSADTLTAAKIIAKRELGEGTWCIVQERVVYRSDYPGRALMLGLASLIGFVLTVPVANWMIGNIGTCIPDGPCVIPVGFGLSAPSGVLVVGLALVLRDLVHRLGGPWTAIGAILVGCMLSAAFAPPALVLASAMAFLMSELADFGVYAPLHRKKLVAAVLASGLVGAIVDSAVFLWLAFGSLDFLAGQVLGKFWATAFAALVIASFRLPPEIDDATHDTH